MTTGVVRCSRCGELEHRGTRCAVCRWCKGSLWSDEGLDGVHRNTRDCLIKLAERIANLEQDAGRVP